MPKHSFDAFSKLVKSGEIPSAVYLYGEEDVLKDEAVRAILDRLVEPGLRDFNVDQRGAGQLDPEAVEILCNTLPMMADRRVVIIREVEAWNKRMLGFQGPAQPSPTLGDAINAGFGYLEVKCLGCNTHQTVALDIVRRPKAMGPEPFLIRSQVR